MGRLNPKEYAQAHQRLRATPHALESALQEAVKTFRAHSLKQQEEVTLADRTDSKYLLPVSVLIPLVEALGPEYTILEDGDNRVFSYENTYFDTPCYKHYHDHHKGKLNRHKWRFRRYRETGVSYLEFKRKTNQERTVKQRESWPNEGEQTLSMPDDLAESLYVSYRRVTLWNHSSNERLTIDYDLRWRQPGQSRQVSLGDSIIVELKRDGKVYGSEFVRRAKEFGYLPTSFSKYCVGLCVTDDGQLKKNKFKSLLNKLQWAEI